MSKMMKLPKALLFGKVIRKREKEEWRTWLGVTSAGRLCSYLLCASVRPVPLEIDSDHLGRNVLPIIQIVDGVQEPSRAISRKSVAESTTYKSYPF
jgi:hypothetical protein